MCSVSLPRFTVLGPCFVMQCFVSESYCPFYFCNHLNEEERASCYTLYSCCHGAVCVLCLFLPVLWAGLWSVIMAFSCHTSLLFLKEKSPVLYIDNQLLGKPSLINMVLRKTPYLMGTNARKPVFQGLRTIKAQTSLHVCSAPLLF